jgi:hypothetical protein
VWCEGGEGVFRELLSRDLNLQTIALAALSRVLHVIIMAFAWTVSLLRSWQAKFCADTVCCADQGLYVASLESAVGGGQTAYDIRNVRDHFEQRPVDIAEAINCPPLAAMLNPNLDLHLATAGHGFQVPPSPPPAVH